MKKSKKLFWMVFSIIAVILFVFVIPIIINWLYSRPASISLFAMSWEAKDALAFYGSILGAVATIFALVATIRFTTNNQKEERKLSIKPYLQTKQIHKPEFDSLFRDDLHYVTVHKGIITNSVRPPDELLDIKILYDRAQKAPAVKGMLRFTSFEDAYVKFFTNNYVFIYEIANFGAGNAVNVDLSINGIMTQEGFCISTGEPKRFVFILNEDLVSDESKISIKLKYCDICTLGKYLQEESFKMVQDECDEFVIIRFDEDLITQPREINKTEE